MKIDPVSLPSFLTASAMFLAVQIICTVLLTSPLAILHPDWHVPDDGLDALTRKGLKVCLCCVINVPPLLVLVVSSMRR